MKRKRDSVAVARPTSQGGNEAKGKVEDTKSDELWSYFDNLPSHVTSHILLQLPIKSLLICRCVCKNWKTMISEPHFTKLHFEQAQTCVMIRPAHYNIVARTMHFLECVPENFEIGSNNHVNLEPIFKLPLRDAKSFREKRDVINSKSKRPLRAARLVSEKNNENKNKGKQRRYIACNPYHDKFNIVNSCNGFVCLCHPHPHKINPLVICNPVTGEFIRLPVTLNKDPVRLVGHGGFGFHSKTNEYKVIIMWRRRYVFEPVILEIHTLGTLLWRNVEVDLHISIWDLECPTCLNVALHWIRRGNEEQRSILCFSFESERLQSFPSPPHVFGNHNGIHYNNTSMGEIRGFLYICDISLHDVTLWVMNQYGIAESWAKVYNIDTSTISLFNKWRRYGLCFTIKHFKEGAANAILLLLYGYSNCSIYYETEKNEFKAFQIQGSHSNHIEVISHIPSLISLKDVVKEGNIEVLNIHSRCAKFKLREENEVFSLSQII